MKKFISLLLIFTLVLAAVPAFACADSGYIDPDEAYKAWQEAYKKSLASYKYKVFDMQDKGYWYSEKAVTEKEPNNFRFSCSGPYTSFDVFIDGEKIPWDEYISWGIPEGSTFEIDNDYMAELSEGQHRVSVWYTDGFRGAGYFEVVKASGPVAKPASSK